MQPSSKHQTQTSFQRIWLHNQLLFGITSSLPLQNSARRVYLATSSFGTFSSLNAFSNRLTFSSLTLIGSRWKRRSVFSDHERCIEKTDLHLTIQWHWIFRYAFRSINGPNIYHWDHRWCSIFSSQVRGTNLGYSVLRDTWRVQALVPNPDSNRERTSSLRSQRVSEISSHMALRSSS